ncbi:MAG: 1,4-alpha-glucan branching enzyme [Blautia sp.]|jgi:1,4-alpha-glucan branching enzyme
MKDILYQYMDWPRIEAVVYGEERAPRDVMGPLVTDDGILLQCFFPQAERVSVEIGAQKKRYPMKRQDEAGYFACMVPGKEIPEYIYVVEKGKAEAARFQDPYAFPCQISELDEKRFLAGIHYEIYEKLGAHPMEVDGVQGVYFAVWAPNALRVSVVGDFNQWDGRRCPMHRMPASGIFELFLPGVEAGAIYKYEMKLKGGGICLKADPYANGTENLPGRASKVCDLDGYDWQDGQWQKKEEKGLPGTPLCICEVDLASFAEGLESKDYRALGEAVAAYAGRMGYTHVELVPVMEYKENPYATANYYAPTSRFGTAREFMEFVDILHQADIGVIMDWTPAHFPKDPQGLEAFDGTCLYENEDIRKKYHPMWGTLLYNFDSPLVRNFLIANAFFWMRKYHIDGLRMDDVDAMLYLDYGRGEGEWAPNIYGTNENLEAIEFMKHLNSVVRKENPGFLLIAQEDGLWPELTGDVDETHMGFDYKWNRGWTQDFLGYLKNDFPFRSSHHDELSLAMVYGYFESYILTLGRRDVTDTASFLAMLPGDKQQKEAGLKAAYGFQMCHPGGKMHMEMQDAPEGVAKCLEDLIHLYREYPAMHRMDGNPDGFEWVQLMRYEENVLTFLRKTEKEEDTLLVVVNFSPDPYEGYAIGVPYHGKYKEVFNSDKMIYGGSGFVNPRVKMSKKEECDEREHSIRVKVPPLGISIYAYSKVVEKVAGNTAAKKKTAAKKAAAKNLKAELERKIEIENEKVSAKGRDQ